VTQQGRPRGAGIDRRRFLQRAGLAAGGLLIAPAFLAACGDDDDSTSASGSGGGGGDTKTVKFQLDWLKNAEFAGWYMAADAGFYAQEGLESSLLPGADVASHEAVIAGGGAQMGNSSFLSRTVDAALAGSELVVVGAGFQESPAGLMSLPDNPIRTVEDIVGKRIGLQEGSAPEIDTLLKLAGLPVDYEEVPVGFDPTPLTEGLVDGYYCYVTSQPLTLAREGIAFETATMKQLGWQQYGMLMVTTREFLDGNRDTVKGYLRATIKGWELALQDKTKAIDLTMDQGQDLGLERDVEEDQLDAQIPLMQSELVDEKGLYWFDADLVAGPMYDALVASGRENLPDVDSIVDLSLLEEIYDGKTSLL
jgi:ABC-type nitrate/sulfonate/bicarbonate transport system substrate-binding protein